MKRLLTTTAIVAMAAMPLAAQENSGSDQSEVQLGEEQMRMSSLMDTSVYMTESGEAPNWDEVEGESVPDSWIEVGTITDVFLDQDGSIAQVVLEPSDEVQSDAGQVAIDMGSLEFHKSGEGEEAMTMIAYTGDQLSPDTEGEDMAAAAGDMAATEGEGEDMAAAEGDMAATEGEGEDMAAAEGDMAATEGEGEDMAAAEGDMAATEGEAEDMAAAEGDMAATEGEGEDMAAAEGDMAATEGEGEDMAAAEGDMAATEGEGEDMAASEGDMAATEGEGEDMAAAEMSQEARDALTAEDLEGQPVFGTDGNRIGEIGELVLNDEGKIEQVIFDVGGFLGLGEKPVAVSFDSVTIMEDPENSDLRVETEYTEEELDEMERWED